MRLLGLFIKVVNPFFFNEKISNAQKAQNPYKETKKAAFLCA